MKTVINGRIYNTDTMTTLCRRTAYHDGNEAGETRICKTRSGHYALVIDSNGQDLYRQDSIEAIQKQDIPNHIDGWNITDDDADLLIAEGIVTDDN